MSFERRVLTREEVHWGFPCMVGTEIDSFERSGTLARDFHFRAVLLPGGSPFCMDVDFGHRRVTLSRSTTVHGVELARGSVVEFRPFFEVPFSAFCLVLWWPVILLAGILRSCRGEATLIPSQWVLVAIHGRAVLVDAEDRITVDRRGVRAVSTTRRRQSPYRSSS